MTVRLWDFSFIVEAEISPDWDTDDATRTTYVEDFDVKYIVIDDKKEIPFNSLSFRNRDRIDRMVRKELEGAYV
jgi:hypothetical protein